MYPAKISIIASIMALVRSYRIWESIFASEYYVFLVKNFLNFTHFCVYMINETRSSFFGIFLVELLAHPVTNRRLPSPN